MPNPSFDWVFVNPKCARIPAYKRETDPEWKRREYHPERNRNWQLDDPGGVYDEISRHCRDSA